MRALLDVNVLIALFDTDHSLHAPALAWFSRHAGNGWASCPITQNGFLRVMSHPGYANTMPVRVLMERLAAATRAPQHEFWSDDLTLLDAKVADPARIHGPRQLTDVYLLALAVHHAGQFVTFDQSVLLDAVRGAAKRHLLTL